MLKSFILCVIALVWGVTVRAGADLSWRRTGFDYIFNKEKYRVEIEGKEITDASALENKVFALISMPDAGYADALRAYEISNGKIAFKWERDIRKLNAWKVRVADVDGDGEPELILGVWKKSRFHPVNAKRIFIYSLTENGIMPKWLGSRLSKPVEDFEFFDLFPELIGAELVAVERTRDASHCLAVWTWNGFGFDFVGEITGKFNFKNITVRDNMILVNSIPLKRMIGEQKQ